MTVMATRKINKQSQLKQKQAVRKFVCEFENCGKAFTRAEHLQRHELNHRESENTCQRCRAHFARPDLLERHMDRHAQKDREAGGEGLGILVTRKRCWRDEDGRITTKRPASSTAALAEIQKRRNSIAAAASNRSSPVSRNSERAQSAPQELQNAAGGRDGIVSPRYSASSAHKRRAEAAEHPRLSPVHSQHEALAGDPRHAHPHPQQPQRYHLDPMLAHPPSTAEDLLAACQTNYDEVYAADTASSFNMPYTTLSNYNWLFDDIRPPQPPVTAQEQLSGVGLVGTSLVPGPQHQSAHSPNHGGSYESDSLLPTPVDEYFIPLNSGSPEGDSKRNQAAWEAGYRPERAAAVRPGIHEVDRRLAEGLVHMHQGQPPHPLYDYQQAAADSTPTFPALPQSEFAVPAVSAQSHTPHPLAQNDDHTSGATYSHSSPVSTPYFPVTTRPTGETAPLPKIDEIARAQVIDLIVRATSGTSFPISQDDPLLSLDALQNYCDLFFTRFNSAYPLLHRPTFDPSNAPTMLLISVLMLGATYAAKDAHQMAVRVHDVLRGVLMSNEYFHANPEFWVLQTIFLIEVFGKSRAGLKQHDMAHLFHGLLINLIRRSDCQTSSPPGHHAGGCGDLDQDWKVWIHAEEKKRLAIMTFTWDVQHALLFSQTLCMSAFELRLPLPSDPATWDASSAETWHKARAAEHPPPYLLPVIKLFLNPSKQHPPPQLNSLGRNVVLYGLMSIQWDMRRRDQTSLGFHAGNDSMRGWQTRIEKAYDAWKADFDSYCAAVLSSSASMSHLSTSTDRDDFQKFRAATNAVYHAANIVLAADILDLQIYAGARNILGKPVVRADYDRSRRAVRAWARAPGAARAVWHGATMVREGIARLQDWNVDGRFIYPWCLYLATLTNWAFCFALGGGRSEFVGGEGGEAADGPEADLVWDARKECLDFVETMCAIAKEDAAERITLVTAGAARTAGLVAVVARHLETVRWALVHEGMKVLRGLIAGRIIRGFDAGACN